MISYEDFTKVEMKTGKIITAEVVEGSEKLYKLMVDIGEEHPRQVLAGIQKFYTQDDLIDKTVIIVTNLEVRQMMGLESQGMMLAADGEKPIFLTTAEPATPGSKIR